MPGGVPRIAAPHEWALTKTCTRCGETKPWAKFPPRRYWPDGTVRVVASHCHQCDSKLSIARSPRYREKHRAYKTEWQRRKRKRLREQNDAANAGPRLPVGPLRVWLLRLLTGPEGFPDDHTLALAAGIDDRVLHRLLRESDWVPLVQADRILTRLGGHLDELYPYDQEAA